MKYVYGPVPSRRLGRSLGVSPIPSKTCNYSCVYCQLGRTDHFTNLRKDFFDPQEILKEIFQSVEENRSIDYITFVGEGEPTLCKSIGYLIDQAKLTHLPVAVITNGALLYDEDVRMDLRNADVVLPSLDAGSEETFLRINRPHKEIKFERMVEGLKQFSKIRTGQLWVEVMLVKGLNDSEEEIKKIKNILKDVNPDRVYINVPIRPPAEPWVEIPDEESIAKAHEILESYVISGYEEGEFNVNPEHLYDEILKICERHPMREDQIKEICLKFNARPEEIISKMRNDKSVKEISYHEKRFFVVKPKMEGRP
ncbi:radical SAM protein [Athalassotoga saccharophila]|uniref:radical SAM protein n=1 Tax=Athalassotoga saccharophila TaxID=1441386 RepID=UPI00137A924E|nr:radical SAM protein [Athalassotoga saccharophila]BBJ28986.1 Dual-specificity RNA methyltransferase RlmN [Athalassotoga saccharophila]